MQNPNVIEPLEDLYLITQRRTCIHVTRKLSVGWVEHLLLLSILFGRWRKLWSWSSKSPGLTPPVLLTSENINLLIYQHSLDLEGSGRPMADLTYRARSSSDPAVPGRKREDDGRQIKKLRGLGLAW